MKRKQQYPLEIVESCEIGSYGPPISYWTKGHHNIEAFGDALRDFFTGERGEELTLDYQKAEHMFMRYCPTGEGSQMQALVPTSDGPGAFPVTYLDADCP